jgi:hypothetical protein
MSILEDSKPGLKSFIYAVGMFGASIPINMLKTFAAIYYGYS